MVTARTNRIDALFQDARELQADALEKMPGEEDYGPGRRYLPDGTGAGHVVLPARTSPWSPRYGHVRKHPAGAPGNQLRLESPI